MAILSNRRSKVSDEIPASSMADIAFLLLIFFLVTTVFPKDKGLQLTLPPKDQEVEVSQKNVLFLLVQPNGSIDVRRGESEDIQNIDDPQQIQSIWTQGVSENPGLIAAVHTHPDAEYRYTIAVLDALKLAGASRISMAQADLGGE
jgi:biopolymer transport protein ExbD